MSETGPPTYRLEDLKQRWEQNPNSRLYLQLAEEYRRLGRLEEAVQVLEQGLEGRPGDLSARVALGRYSLEMGDVARAEEALAAAVERDPTHLVANKALLEVYLLQGSAEKAGERLEIYRLLNDRDPELEHLEFRLHSLRQSEQEEAPAPSAAEVELEELISNAGISTASEAPSEEAAEAFVESSPREEAPGDSGASEIVDLEATQPTLQLADLEEEPVVTPLAEDLGSTGGNEMSEKKTESKAGDLFDLGTSSAGVPGFDAFWNDFSGDAGVAPAAPPEAAAPPAEDAFGGFGVAFDEPVVEPEPEAPMALVEDAPATKAEVAAEIEGEAERDPFPEPVAVFEAVEPAEGLEVEPAELAAEPLALEALEVEEMPEVSEPEPLALETPVPSLSEAEPFPGTPEMEAADVSSVEAEAVEVEALEMEAVDLESVQVESPPESAFPEALLAKESSEVEDVQPAAIEVETPAFETPAFETPALEAPAFETAPEEIPAPVVDPAVAPVINEIVTETAAPPEIAEATEATEEASAGDEVATVTLGSLYLKQGHVEEARRIFEKVLESDPKNHAALAGLGLTRKSETTGLTAMDLLAGRSMAGTIPAGVTAKKMLILTNYLKHLKNARERNHVR